MITSTPPDNTVLVLRPPIVNGQTRPVVGAHIGLPLVAYDLVTDGKGAVVLVDPPLDDTMDPGDVMELWLEGESAALDSKTIEDPDVRTTLRIPKGRLHPDKVNVLYYTIRRGSNNRGESTPLEILYNRIRPGLKDRYDAPGGHSELELLLPEVIRNGVDPDFVDAQVSVSYPYCRAYDSITLKCNGEQMTVKVKPTEAPPPLTQARKSRSPFTSLWIAHFSTRPNGWTRNCIFPTPSPTRSATARTPTRHGRRCRPWMRIWTVRACRCRFCWNAKKTFRGMTRASLTLRNSPAIRC
ncbi:hypothetical protein [Pseudomonas monsensis]|uniref:hypothetical protein n=1 Tax=Pseudomonas monsensis TaxID=2745509 RepID=UPI002AB98134|nr:hypothetical protein [Pseudomonas monsensis]MDZ3826849.1 hypothetical protein [Pseudomonas monsensis]